MSQLSQYLNQGQFCVLVEYLCTNNAILPVVQELAGFPALMTLADRVHADDDISPLEASRCYSKSIDKILHSAGKDRDIQDFDKFLVQA